MRARLIIRLFLLALAARVLFLIWQGPRLAPDSFQYLRLAHNLIWHGTFSLDAIPPFRPSIWRPPLYPAFLTVLSGAGTPAPLTVAALQSVLDSATAVFVLLLARAVVPARWALAAALAYAVHPGALLMQSFVLSETLFTFLLVTAVWAATVGLQQDRPGLTALGGVGIGMAALCRPVSLLLPLVFLVPLGLMPRVPRRYIHGAAMLACTVLVVAPWIARCARVSHRFVLIQGISSADFYVATRWDRGDGYATQSTDWDRLWRDDPYLLRYQRARTAEQTADADAAARRQGLRNILANPAGYLTSRVRSIPHLFLSSFDFITGVQDPIGALAARRAMGPLLIKLSIMGLFSLLPFVLGLIGLNRGLDRPASALCAAVWTYMLAALAPMWLDYRFWLPALPFLLVSAASGAFMLAGRLAGSGHRRRPVDQRDLPAATDEAMR